MKTSFKKLFYILTAFLVVVGMGLSSVKAADETGSITITNPATGVTYTPYKIFDTAVNGAEDSKTYVYSISSNSPWFSWLKDKMYLTTTQPSGTAGEDFNQVEVLTTADGKTSTTGYYFTVNETNVISFANDVQTAIINDVNKKEEDRVFESAADGQPGSNTNTSIVFNGLPLGYYIVSPSVVKDGVWGSPDAAVNGGAIANLTSNEPDRTISPKSTKPTVVKSAKEDGKPTDGSVSVGDVVEFTLKGYVPDTTGYSDYKYILKDTMNNMTLLIDDSHQIKVTVGGNALTNTEENKFWTSTGTNGVAGLEVKIDVPKLQSSEYIGKEINVTYFATITDAAATAGANNSVILTYGPNLGEETDKSEVIFSTTSINVLKVDNSNPANPLAGAKFTLKQDIKDGKYYQGISGNASVWGSDATDFVTNKDGKLVFNGIEAGDYILTETKAPDGFTLLANPIQISVDKDGNVSFKNDYSDSLISFPVNAEDNTHKTVVVTNVIGGHLPETGGSGTTMLYVAGGILVAGAAIVLITKKRMEA